MSENKEKDFTERFNTVKDEALKAMRETTETVLKKLDTEKRKAEIRSEIGHNARELSKAYEKLGREYFLLKEGSIQETDEKETFAKIRDKEKLIELLNEKLDQLDKE